MIGISVQPYRPDKGAERTVLWQSDLSYRSLNGDAWHLLREVPSACILVRPVANPASGGQVTDLSVEDLLSINGPGSEHRILRELLARLARPVRPVPAT